MSSIVREFSWSELAKHMLLLSVLALSILSLGPVGLKAQESTLQVKAGCLSAEMARLFTREGSTVRVSPRAELVAEPQGARENEKGITLALDPERALLLEEGHRWFEKAARKGYAPAQVNLAVLSLAGWGAPQNAGTALYWLREAARQGYALAYFDLGILYLGGCGVRQDYHEAFQYFEQGASAGDSAAQMNLGYLYDQGLGVVQDRAQAARWYRRAAESGVAQAEYNLGDLYLRGEGVPLDESGAFRWFQKAALQGHSGARILLGLMYAEGRGTAKNFPSAYTWLSAAALQGDDRGSAMLRAIEQQLTPDLIARAKLRAEGLNRPPNPTNGSELALDH